MSKEQCISLIERLNVVIDYRDKMCEGFDPEASELHTERNKYQRLLMAMN